MGLLKWPLSCHSSSWSKRVADETAGAAAVVVERANEDLAGVRKEDADIGHEGIIASAMLAVAQYFGSSSSQVPLATCLQTVSRVGSKRLRSTKDRMSLL